MIKKIINCIGTMAVIGVSIFVMAVFAIPMYIVEKVLEDK